MEHHSSILLVLGVVLVAKNLVGILTKALKIRAHNLRHFLHGCRDRLEVNDIFPRTFVLHVNQGTAGLNVVLNHEP